MIKERPHHHHPSKLRQHQPHIDPPAPAWRRPFRERGRLLILTLHHPAELVSCWSMEMQTSSTKPGMCITCRTCMCKYCSENLISYM